MTEVSKGDFATLRGVSAARVSQWISAGKLFGPALVGEGIRAKINLEVATEQLGALDPVQVQAQRQAPTPAGAALSDEDRRIRAAKAEQAELDLRQKRRAEQDQLGVYCRTEDVQRAWTRELTELLLGIENWLPDLAMALKGEFGIDRKLATVALRREFRAFRQRRSDLAKSAAAELPTLVPEAAE